MHDGKSDKNREKEEKRIMMKKLTAVSVVLILMLALFTSCDKDKKDSSKKDSTKSESTKDSSAGTDYKVRADREIMDESATLTVFATSFSEYNNLAEKLSDKDKEVIELQAEEGMEFRKELDSLSWFNACSISAKHIFRFETNFLLI